MSERRNDIGQKFLVAAFVIVFGLFINTVWKTAVKSGEKATLNSIKIARLEHMEKDIKEIKDLLYKYVLKEQNTFTRTN